MKRKITLIRLVHDDRPRIGLRHDLDPAMNAMIRKIPGIVYSGTHRVWHLEARDDIVGFLNFRFNNRYEIDDSQLASQATGSGPEPRSEPRSEQPAPQRSETPATQWPGPQTSPKSQPEPSSTPRSDPQNRPDPSITHRSDPQNRPDPSITHRNEPQNRPDPSITHRSDPQNRPAPSITHRNEPRSEQPAPQRSETPATQWPGPQTSPKSQPEPHGSHQPGPKSRPEPQATHGISQRHIPSPATASPPPPRPPATVLPDEAAIQKNITLPKCRVELANVPGSGKIMVKFHGYYDKAWIAEMRQYGFVEYLKQRKEFRLPYSRIAMDSLSDYFSSCGLQVDVRRNKMPVVVKSRRDEVAGEVRTRQLGDKALEGVRLLEAHVREKRQSESTVKTYSSMLQLFFRYFSDLDPKQIKEADISTFMADFVLPLGYSASFQNQMVTAIKTYYSLTDSRFRGEKLMRPRRSRVLPKVFSKEEIRRILNATVNIKHRLILWMIYSCGLRRGEILNIRLADLDRDRNVLHIRQGKGNVDRVVPVSGKVWDKIDEYIEGYSPAYWLFEGTGGGKYSAGSVYNVFKKALLRAGIKKEVGVHALRHSYATHLHESGLDIRFIQELLGHRSSRTTEIYTHVSRRNLMSIKSPIDDIDLK